MIRPRRNNPGMIADLASSHEIVPPAPRYALDACALAHGAIRGPALLCSSRPAWEHTLRLEIGDQLFTVDDPDRPAAQAWMGAVWLEPHARRWRSELEVFTRLLPQGGLMSIVLSLPVALIHGSSVPGALGARPTGLWQLRAALIEHGFKVERSFGFQTIWSSVVRWTALRLRSRRPDLGDRLQFAVRRSYAARRYLMPFAAVGLIEARAGMRP